MEFLYTFTSLFVKFAVLAALAVGALVLIGLVMAYC
jgi:hypothetical protein